MAVQTTHMRTATSGVLSSCWQPAYQSPHHLQQHTSACLCLPVEPVLHRTSSAKMHNGRTANSAGISQSGVACEHPCMKAQGCHPSSCPGRCRAITPPPRADSDSKPTSSSKTHPHSGRPQQCHRKRLSVAGAASQQGEGIEGLQSHQQASDTGYMCFERDLQPRSLMAETGSLSAHVMGALETRGSRP